MFQVPILNLYSLFIFYEQMYESNWKMVEKRKTNSMIINQINWLKKDMTNRSSLGGNSPSFPYKRRNPSMLFSH